MSSEEAQLCSIDLLPQGTLIACQQWEENKKQKYNCSLPGLQELTPGQYEGVTANYLSFNTDVATPHYRTRAKEIETCTGGTIQFSEAKNIFKDPIKDLGTKTSPGSEVYDAYLMVYSFTSEASSLGLLETLNERISKKSQLQYLDMFEKVRAMGEYRKDGKTNIDLLMADGDFIEPVIRIDLLEKYDLPLPNTWEEVVEYAKFFHGKDLNDDGIEDGYGMCYFPFFGSPFDEWVSELIYSTWATFDQTHGINQGFFFDENTFEPRIGESFGYAAEIWKDLFAYGAPGCEPGNFNAGKCFVGFAPPGCWKGTFVNSDGVARYNEEGNIIWQPKMKSGEYATPYRFRTFGSTKVVDRKTGKFVDCTLELCPLAERIPEKMSDRASILPPSPLAGKLINRAPFYWAGGFGNAIRKSADPKAKDLIWDFYVYVNSPETSVHDVVQPSWLDEWRYSHLAEPGQNFLDAGWSEIAYKEQAAIMNWGLGPDVNSAFNLRIPGVLKYTSEIIGSQLTLFVNETITKEQLIKNIYNGWEETTAKEGKLDQLKIYRASLGLEEMSEFDLCSLHRSLMDARDPSVCIKYDPATTSASNVLVVAILVPILMVVLLIGFMRMYMEHKRRAADAVWQISKDELKYNEPPEVAGRGTFGLVTIAEYRGTHVAVKQVIPPKEKVASIEAAKHKGDGETARRTSMDYVENDTDFYASASAIMLRKNLNTTDTYNAMESGTMSSGMHSGAYNSNGNTEQPERRSSTGSIDSMRRSSMEFIRRTSNEVTNAITNKSKSSKHYEQLKNDFIQEMRILSKLRHPCITTVMGCVMQKGEEPMLVMEYMENGSLYDLLHNETIVMDGDLIFPMLQDIARGARFLHAATPKIIHGGN